MNYYAVKALQARVALWEGNYQRAANAADSVFNHLRNVSTRNQLFYYVTPGKYGSDYSFSREYIFGISSTPTGFTALSNSLFKSLGVTTINLRGIYQQNTDIRYRAWFKSTKLYKNHLESFATNRAMTLKTKLCILLPATLMLALAFFGMSHKDTTGTRIGRITIIVLLILKYLYFFTRIRTIKVEKRALRAASEPAEGVAPTGCETVGWSEGETSPA